MSRLTLKSKFFKVFFLMIIVFCIVAGLCFKGHFYYIERKTFPFRHAGLNWSEISKEEMSYSDAVEYCSEIGGRLPEICELRTLVINCPGTMMGGACGVSKYCTEIDCWNRDVCWSCSAAGDGRYSVFEDTEALWSSSILSGETDISWSLFFSLGLVSFNYQRSTFYVRCVNNTVKIKP